MTTKATGLTEAWHPHKYHPVQAAVMACRRRFLAIPAGRGSGKTELAKRRLVMALAEPKPWSDPRYFFAADTIGHAKEIAWEGLLALIPRDWVAYKRESIDSLQIRTRFGSALYLLGMSKPQHIEGRQWDGGVIDESCDVPPGIFDRSVVPALTWRHGWCWRIGVPKRHGIGVAEFRRFFEEARERDIPDRASFTWPSSDILPPEALEYARQNLSPRDYREQFEASFEAAGGMMLWAFDRIDSVRPIQYRPDLPLVVGCDFNVDPMAWTIGHRYANRLEWFDELWVRNTNTREVLDMLWSKYQDHQGQFEFYCDASGGQRRTSADKGATDLLLIANDERFKAAKGGRVIAFPRLIGGKVEGNPGFKARIEATNAMLLNATGERRMFIAPNCTHLIADFEARAWKEGQTVADDKGDVGHMTDAIGYAVWRLFPIRLILDERKGSVIMTRGRVSPALQGRHPARGR